MNCNLTLEAAAQFQEGINLVLSRWAALRIAVENEWGGRASEEKPQQLSEQLFNFFTQSKEQIYIDEVEDMLEEFMLSLNTEIGDGSIEEVAEKVMVMHEECLEGNFNSIKKLQQTSIPSLSYKRQPNGDDDDSDDDDDGDEKNNSSMMDVDAPRSQSRLSQNVTVNEPTLTQREASAPEVEDGWTVVSRRGKGRKD